MQNALISLAEEIIKGGERAPQANLHFKSLINQGRNLDQCLQSIQVSDNFTFVYCSNMIKLIQSGQFCLISQTKSEGNVVDLVNDINNTKIKVYGSLISELTGIALYNNKPQYLSKTVKDLIALCLKSIFQENRFLSFLQKFVNIFHPNYCLVESFNSLTQNNLNFIEPRYNLDYNLLNNYCILLQILNSMLQFITVQSTSKTYFEYRRSIYIFRNTYLAHLLYLAVQNWKMLLQVKSDNLRGVVQLTIQLLQHVFLYPFTLSVHDENEQDFIDNFSCGQNDFYFPNYFRHVICDIAFLQTLQQYTYFLINNQEPFEQKRNEINSLVKVLGRVSCSSQYTFKNDEQKQFCRKYAIIVVKRLCEKYRYSESYYLNNIMDILYKMLTTYDFYFNANRPELICCMLQFLYKVIQQSEINIEEGKQSPFARTFQLLSLSLQYCKDKSEEEMTVHLRFSCQKILQKAFERILSPEANIMVYRFGNNHPTEIECFEELFEFVGCVFQSNLDTNLILMDSINIYTLQQVSIVIWLHLCAQLICKATANFDQTRIVLKYYQLAKNGDSLASLKYLRTLVSEVMSDIHEDIPANPLWVHIQQISPIGFEDFILSIIGVCIGNFKLNNNNQVLDYSLQLFKTIYTNLKRFESKAFAQFYKIVQNLLQNIEQTVFAHPKYFTKRQEFFNVISVIWINSDNLSFVYKIDSLIRNNLQSNSIESFFQYLHDITGLLEPLDQHLAFEVLSQLTIDELSRQFSIHLGNQAQIKRFFKEAYCIKIFCRLTNALIQDITRKLFFETHTKIPLRIHRLLFPYIKFLTDSQEFDFPRKFATLLQKMVTLNPLSQLVNFSKVVKLLKQNDSQLFDKLVKTYFNHIQRVADISWMYDLIGGNPDFMVYWWQEAMIRNLRPKINFKVIAQSRFWKNAKQRETFAKLIFELGYYEKEYWNVDGFESERLFVDEFARAFA